MSNNNIIQIGEKFAWVIRSTYEGKQYYFITDVCWSSAPSSATIFRTEAHGAQMLELHLSVFHLKEGEIMEVVPLAGAIINASKEQKK